MAEFKGADGKTYTFIDADTISDGENRYRIEGFNAPEKGKATYDDEGNLRLKQGQLGGSETQSAVEQIAANGGFNVIEDLGRTDSFGRKRIRIKNELGDDLTNTLYSAGAIDVNLFTDEDGIQAAQQGALREELRGKRVYDDIVSKELSDIQNRPITFKETALNEEQYRNAVIETIANQKGLNLGNEEDYREAYNMAISGNYDARSLPFEGIDFRSMDRTKEGVAVNQFGTAWNQGWNGMATGLAGFAELIGVGLGNETIEKWGANKVSLAKQDLADAPLLTNMDYRDVDSIWDAWGFMSNNVAMSAPYLITLTAGTLAAPVTGGASATIAYGSVAGSYAGQVWNDIEGEKSKDDAAGAIMAGTAMAVLDRIGLAGIIKPSQLLTTAGRAEVARHLAKTKGIPITEAKTIIREATKKDIKHLIEGMGNFATDNINNSNIMRSIMTGAGRGGLAEGLTEASQEGLGYLASGEMSDGGIRNNFNPDEFINLLTASAIAGGTLGAGFGASGQVIEAGDRYAVMKGVEKGNIDKQNEYQQIVADMGQQGSTQGIIDDINKEVGEQSISRDNSLLVQEAERGKQNEGTLWDKVKNAPTYLPRLFRTSATTAFRPEVLRSSEAARKLYALIGQPFGKLYTGVGVEGYESEVRSNLTEIINPKRTFARFGMRDSVTNSQKISDMIRRYERGERDAEVMNNLESIEVTIKELEAFAEADYALKTSTYVKQGKDRDALPKKEKWWLNHQSWDWQKVRNNRQEWYSFMRKHTDYTSAELDVLYNKISNNEDATDFSIVEGVEFLPGSARQATDQISSKPGYDKFANTNILQNMINAATQTAKYHAYTEYFGAGGKNIDYLLNKMIEEGLDADEVAHIAYHSKNIIDAATGNYKNIKNRTVAKIQRTAAFYSTLVGLPLSAISSSPEFGMILYQGRGGADVKRGIEKAVGEVRDMLKGIVENKKTLELDVPRANIDRKGQERLTKAGLFADDASIATRLGLGETDVSKAWWQKQFFKYTGIAGITQLQRAMAASAVSGFVGDRIRILAAKAPDAEYNQNQLEVYLQLTDLGIDVDGFIKLYNKYNDPRVGLDGETLFDTLMDENPATQADFEFIDAQMNNATWHFVNERVQNPQAFNRPLFFQDPHFQLFVQFNGFISTFTANVVPKLWNDYLRNGSPKMQYNTFALMVTMMALAGGSQWLKDYLKFGGSSPYLSEAQLLQRALQSSGLLGTGERVLQAALPLYKSRDEGIMDRLFGETVGGSPTVRNLITAGKAVEALSTGDTERAARHGTKLIPGIGVYTPGRNVITDAIHGKPIDPFPFKEGE